MRFKPQVISGRFCQLILLAIIVWAIWNTAVEFWEQQPYFALIVFVNVVVISLAALAIFTVNDLIKGE